jgi:hypothetical protein
MAIIRIGQVLITGSLDIIGMGGEDTAKPIRNAGKRHGQFPLFGV